MAADRTPPAEIDIDAALVRALLAEQHPDLAQWELNHVDSGWDNEMFRLGSDLAVRLPRRETAASLVVNEQRWLPGLAPRLPLAVPEPVRSGRPGSGYPWPWSVTRWVPGEVAGSAEPADPVAAAVALGGFLSALHVPAPAGAPVNPHRGVPLQQRDALVREHLEALDLAVDLEAILACWSRLAATPPWTGPPLWLHGDLHPLNILTSAGRLTGVIDWGDITAGDPASDLAVAWMLLPSEARPVLRASAGEVDDDTWDRARGWALALALAMYGTKMSDVARRTLHAALADR